MISTFLHDSFKENHLMTEIVVSTQIFMMLPQNFLKINFYLCVYKL